MAKYKILSGKHTRREDGEKKRYVPGDIMEDPPQHLIDIGDRVELVEEDSIEPDPEPVDDYSEILGGNVPDVVSFLEILDDPEDVRDLMVQEAEGKDRAGVEDAAYERLDELEG